MTIFGSLLDDAAFVIAFSQSLSARKLLGFCGFCRLFRLRDHVVDGGLDLGVAQRRIPAFGRHRSRAPRYPINGAGVESVDALGDALGPVALIIQLRRAGDPVGINLEFRGGLVLPVAFEIRK